MSVGISDSDTQPVTLRNSEGTQFDTVYVDINNKMHFYVTNYATIKRIKCHSIGRVDYSLDLTTTFTSETDGKMWISIDVSQFNTHSILLSLSQLSNDLGFELLF